MGSSLEGTGNYFEFVYADLATFGKAPRADSPGDLADADLGVFGVPWDSTATLRPGARLGPRRIREQSQWFAEVWNPAGTPMAGYAPRGDRVAERMRIVDCGDATVVPTDVGRTAAAIRTVAGSIAAKAMPLMLGGDHYVMFPTYQGVTDAHPGKVVGIVQIDAHNDLIDDDPVLGRHWSGTPIRRSIEHAGLDPRAVGQIGLRGFVGENELPAQREQGFVVVPLTEARELGARACAEMVMTSVLRHCDGVYLTIDIDSVDPSCAPGCCTPVPGGLLSSEFLELLRELGRYREIVAIDLVEVAPPIDPTGQTEILAAHGLFGFIEQRFLREPVERPA